jgi:putative ABC transport system permease protein
MAVGQGKDIRSQFLVTLVLSIPGIGGILLGLGQRAVAPGDWPISFNRKPSLAFLFSGLVGVFFGFYPAQKAGDWID